MDGKSKDLTAQKLRELYLILPEIFADGRIDFEKFKEEFTDYIIRENERYSFTWNGKNAALRLSRTPSTGTLRPCREKSLDWERTGNLYIEGENLEVLKLLQKSYYGKIKMIYIDPPIIREMILFTGMISEITWSTIWKLPDRQTEREDVLELTQRATAGFIQTG